MKVRTLQEIEAHFDKQLHTVDELITFDRFILDYCVQQIEILDDRLKNGVLKITNPYYLAENTLKAIKNVRQNNSLRTHYNSMFNSCLVLQVSYFTSTIEDIFDCACFWLYSNKHRDDLNPEELKKRNDIKYQNMGSIKKSFKNYLGIDIVNDSICNTIILAQLSRHAIVHSLALADDKFITNLANASPRDIKRDINRGEEILFSSTELDYVKLAMTQFISILCDKIRNQYRIN
jgi:hypothetical protein